MMKSSQHEGRLKSEYNRNAEDKDVRRVKLMTNYNVCNTKLQQVEKRHSQNEPLQYSQFDKLTTTTIMIYQ